MWPDFVRVWTLPFEVGLKSQSDWFLGARKLSHRHSGFFDEVLWCRDLAGWLRSTAAVFYVGFGGLSVEGRLTVFRFMLW